MRGEILYGTWSQCKHCNTRMGQKARKGWRSWTIYLDYEVLMGDNETRVNKNYVS